jgi:hypothetical protein
VWLPAKVAAAAAAAAAAAEGAVGEANDHGAVTAEGPLQLGGGWVCIG